MLLLLLGSHLCYGYTFNMTCDKTALMVGQKAELTLTLRYSNLEDYNIEEPKFENFSSALVEDTEKQDSNHTWQVIQRYTLTPQKAGTFTLTSPTAHLESIAPQYQERYNRNKYLVKTDIQAKPLTLNISPLPQGLKVTGTYTLSTEVDKQKVKAGEPVHFTLHLKGEGNIADLSFFTLAIPHTTVYETSTSANKKEFDIVSDHNYTIPALSLQYYNQSTQSAELLASQAFGIEVTTAPTPQKSKTNVLFILVLIFTGLLYYLYRLFSSLAHLDKKATFIKALKKCKTKEEILAKVAPYLGKDRGLDRLIFKLEGVEDGRFVGVKREIMKEFDTKFDIIF
jgi:hypothetical protein